LSAIRTIKNTWTGSAASSTEGPADRLSVLFPCFYLKTEAESSFQNAVVLKFSNLDDGQSPKEEIYILQANSTWTTCSIKHANKN
jgi:hypothetical protein